MTNFHTCRSKNLPYTEASRREDNNSYFQLGYTMRSCTYNVNEHGINLLKELYNKEADLLKIEIPELKTIDFHINEDAGAFPAIAESRLLEFNTKLVEILVKYSYPFRPDEEEGN